MGHNERNEASTRVRRAQVALREVDRNNWHECISLSVKPHQVGFILPNFVSLAQCQLDPYCVPFAVYHGDVMVGFLVFGKRSARDPTLWIFHFMISGRYQGRGLGKAALQETLRLLRSKPELHEVKLIYKKQNTVAERLYRGVGFQPSVDVESWPCRIAEGPWNVFRNMLPCRILHSALCGRRCMALRL